MTRCGTWLLVVITIGAACKEERRSAPAGSHAVTTPAPSERVTPGSLRRAPDTTAYLVAVAEAKLTDLPIPDGVIRKPLRELYPPDAMQTITRQLSPDDLQAVSALTTVLVIEGPTGMASARTLASAAHQLADAAGGWVIDPEQLAIEPAAAFARKIPTEPIDARRLIGQHLVGGDGDAPFLVTAGLHRYGFPELLITDASKVRALALSDIANAVAQKLLTGGDVDAQGRITVDFTALGWTENIAGTGTLTLQLTWAREPNTPDSPQVVALNAGMTPEAFTALVTQCFGSAASTVSAVKADDPQLAAVAERARKELTALRSHFAAGVPPTEELGVKARFADGDAVEWMWIDVHAVRGDTFEGTLVNEPRAITALQMGQKVSVPLADVGDYMHTTPSGTVGNYSIEILRKR